MALTLPTTNEERPTTNDSELLVRVECVSKKFCRSLKKSLWYGVQDIAHELNPFSLRKSPVTSEERRTKNSESSLRDDEFWAVNDVSFELRRGECLGLIGHNGAGKTTLLKMLNGLIKPDRGRIEMRGRVGALIALGAGFNPILSGRENIYVNASILGLTKHEINEKVDEIIDFAEIREFIDAPVQSYSSGMQVRLGFAVATALKPDILILDEVLAVGDAGFRAKSLMRVSNLLSHCAVLFVSHSESQVRRISTQSMLMHKGEAAAYGPISDAFYQYKKLKKNQDIHLPDKASFPITLSHVHPFKKQIHFRDDWSLELDFISDPEVSIDLVVFGFFCEGEFWSQSWENTSISLNSRARRLQFNFKSIPLAESTYDITLSMFSHSGRLLKYHLDRVCELEVTGRKCFNVKSQITMSIQSPKR